MHTIVWIHGFPLSSAVFEPQRRIAGYRHVMPDLPGFGATPPVAEASMASYARFVLDAIDVDRFVLAGLSMGGYVAMELVRQVPDRIEAMLLLDTRETPDTDEGRANRLRQAEDVAKNGIAGVVEAMLPKMVVQDAYRDAARRIMESSSPQGTIAALKAMAARPDSTETLRNAAMPAFIIAGDRDELTPMRDAERMVSLLPHAEMAPIARAAHLANYEASEQVNNLIAAFLGRALR